MNENIGMQRVHLIISGNVQGVGFRSWTKWQAKKLGLTGWVKNRDDATVELVAEGLEEQLKELVKRCHKGPGSPAGGALVKHVDVLWLDATGEYDIFEVVH